MKRLIVICFLLMCPVVHAQAPPATAQPPVIWLHYDYMVAADHSHAPHPEAVSMVVEAFRRHGILLHIDPVHNAIPERKVITLGPVRPVCAGDDAVDIHDLRAQYLHPGGTARQHYAVFGHGVTCPDVAHCLACAHDPACGGLPDPTATGAAELPGANFVITFGSFVDAHQQVGLELETATFMHELGHNFGLVHGGSDVCTNQKPNYTSVMNYTYQLGGIPVTDSPGSTSFALCRVDADCSPPALNTGACATAGACRCTDDLEGILGANVCFRVDYSGRRLRALNEFVPSDGIGGLDEGLGVGDDPASTDIILYFAAGPVQLPGPSAGAIDWNNDGDSTDVHVQADLNNDGSFTLLEGFDDWSYLGTVLGNPALRDALARRKPEAVSCAPPR